MVAVATRAQRILESKQKIESPFELDESLCLYSPQDNVDALRHPRIVDWLQYIKRNYTPDLPRSRRRVLLLMPCTKTKPYPFSSEHKHINQRLIEAGFCPVGNEALPTELRERLEDNFSRDVLNLSPLINNCGTVVHRVVISEPLALVPYERIVEYDGKPSPSTAYDDPGLFENRGNAVSPWRPDSTAISVSPTRWRWGDEERRPRLRASRDSTPISCHGSRPALPTGALFSRAMNAPRTTSVRRGGSGQHGLSY
jgi:hypothetical protein